MSDAAALAPSAAEISLASHRRADLYRAAQDGAVLRMSANERKYTTRLASLTGGRDWLFLAMAHQRLGHTPEARQRLGKAVKALEADRRGDPKGSDNFYTHVPWQLRLALRLLRREAETLIEGKMMKPKK